jgi:hypothetical protein
VSNFYDIADMQWLPEWLLRLAVNSKGAKDLGKDAMQSSYYCRKNEDLDEIDQGFRIFEGLPNNFK